MTLRPYQSDLIHRVRQAVVHGAEELHRCTKCGELKPAAGFYIRENGKRRTDCKKCHAIKGRAWVEKNRAKRLEAALKYYRNNKDKSREWKRRNSFRAKQWDREHPVEVRAMKAKWAKAHPEKVCADANYRRTVKLKATPAWVRRAALDSIYAEADRLGLEVDHIIPLRHPLVCGLHVPANLQIIDQSTNRKKSNKFSPVHVSV